MSPTENGPVVGSGWAWPCPIRHVYVVCVLLALVVFFSGTVDVHPKESEESGGLAAAAVTILLPLAASAAAVIAGVGAFVGSPVWTRLVLVVLFLGAVDAHPDSGGQAAAAMTLLPQLAAVSAAVCVGASAFARSPARSLPAREAAARSPFGSPARRTVAAGTDVAAAKKRGDAEQVHILSTGSCLLLHMC